MDCSEKNLIEECMRKLRSGKQFHGEFSELVRRYSRLVFAIVLSRIKDYHRAEEIVQDVFLKAYRCFGSFRNRDSFSAWLGRIARNNSIDALRNAGVQPLSLDEISLDHCNIPTGLYNQKSDIEAGEIRRRVNTAILSLPERLREAAVLRFFENLSYRQIALKLGLPEATVKTRLFRARKMLHRKLSFLSSKTRGMPNALL